jgi:hypothetical protein
MSKIDLRSIQNKNNIEKPVIEKPKAIEKPITYEKTMPKPIFNDKTTVQDLMKSIKQIPIKKTSMTKPIKETIPEVELPKDFDREKQIKVLELYRMEFPKKLSNFTNKKFEKCSDQELISLRKTFDDRVTSNSNIQVGVTMAEKALMLYEYVCVNYANLDITGISELSKQEEWVDNVKALCLKYMSTPITNVSPENKLAFLLISNSIMLHQINTTNKEVGNIEATPQQATSQQAPTESKQVVDPVVMKLQLNNINTNQKYQDL